MAGRRKHTGLEQALGNLGDEGAGFPADFVGKAFERFSQADDARSDAGAGLGLAIVDGIARTHGAPRTSRRAVSPASGSRCPHR